MPCCHLKVNGTPMLLVSLCRDKIALRIKIEQENMLILMQTVLVAFWYTFPFPQPVLLRLILVFPRVSICQQPDAMLSSQSEWLLCFLYVFVMMK